jgi:putative flippase GtrA
VQQFLRFVFSGGLAAALNWLSRFLFSMWMPFGWAVAASFLVGLVSGFLLMRFFVFDGQGKALAPQAAKYVLINLFALLQTLGISLLLAKWMLPAFGLTRYAEALGHLVGILVPVLTSYVGHKRWSFR